jgi:O-antigen/teichoic acid export membrane protein
MVTTLLSPVLWGIARADISATNMMLSAVVIFCACLIGSQWGPVGMAAAWLVAYPVVFIVVLHRSGQPVGLTVRDFWRAMRWPALASLVMAAAVGGTRWLLPISGGVVINLLILVPVGVLVYAGTLLALDRPSIRETLLLGRVKAAESSKSPPPTTAS